LVTVVGLVAVAGCATKRGKQASSNAHHGADSSGTASAGAKHEAKAGTAGHAAGTAGQPGTAGQAGATNRVRLTQHNCIQFEPQWSDLVLGKPLTFYSALKAPVTIHVSGGAFEKTEFVVRPGATVSTGPARATGSYSMWSEPAACQGAPLGARGSGPGVTVGGVAPRK
jgi:hypothetical protein